jgi:cyanate permease
MFIVLGGAGLVLAAAWLAFQRARHETPYAEPERLVSEIGRDFSPGITGAESTRALVFGTLAAEVTSTPTPTSALSTLIRQRTVWGMMLGWGGINYTVWLYLAWLPAYLQDQRHLSLAHTGLVAALPYLAGSVGMWTSGILSDRLAHLGQPLTTIHRRNIVAGMIVSAAATFFVAHSHTTAQAVAGISAALFCIHFAGTSGWGYVQTVSPLRYVASLGALQNVASFMIASAAPILTGWLLDRTHSFNIALGVCSAVALLGALSYATLAAPSGMHLEQEA